MLDAAPSRTQGVILVHEFVAAQPQLQAWGLKPFADPEAEFNRLDATNNTTADGEVDWDEFLAWAVEHKLDRVSAYLGLETGSGGFNSFLEWALELRARFEIPHTLAELGVEEGYFNALAADAAADPTAIANPIALETTDFRELFEAAHTGRLG